MIWCPPIFGGHFMHQSTALQKVHRNSRLPKEVKILQRAIQSLILDSCIVHSSATAYEPGTSISKNAEVHAQNRVILKLDFRAFFPSIKPVDWRKYAKEKLDLDDQSISVCEYVLFWGGGFRKPAFLSIGAPTSPKLSNILMYDLDVQFARICKDHHVDYTRYADDITLSGQSIEALVEVEKQIAVVLSKAPYPKLTFNGEKRGLYTKKARRSVTGLNITPQGHLSLGRERKRIISSMIHKYTLGILPIEELYTLKGLLAFALDNEPAFVNRMSIKYGSDAVKKLQKLHIPSRADRVKS
jgi:RNA-directed DNA polymerase